MLANHFSGRGLGLTNHNTKDQGAKQKLFCGQPESLDGPSEVLVFKNRLSYGTLIKVPKPLHLSYMCDSSTFRKQIFDKTSEFRLPNPGSTLAGRLAGIFPKHEP